MKPRLPHQNHASVSLMPVLRVLPLLLVVKLVPFWKNLTKVTNFEVKLSHLLIQIHFSGITRTVIHNTHLVFHSSLYVEGSPNDETPNPE